MTEYKTDFSGSSCLKGVRKECNISPEDVVNAVESFAQSLAEDSEDFNKNNENLIEIIENSDDKTFPILINTQFYAEIHKIFLTNIDDVRISDLIDTLNTIFTKYCKDQMFLQLVPHEIFEDIFKILKEATERVVLQKAMQCIDSILFSNPNNTAFFLENGLVETLFQLESKYSELTQYWENNIYKTVETCCLANLTRLYYNSPTFFTDELTQQLINVYMSWIVKYEVPSLLIQSLRGLAVIASNDAQVLTPIISVTEYNNKIMTYIRYSDLDIVRSALDLIYFICAEMPEYFDLLHLLNNLRPHLDTQQDKIDPSLQLISCRILAIYFSFESNHEFLISQGVVEMIVFLLNNGLLEVQTEASIALANLLTTASIQTLETVISKYTFLPTFLELINTEQETLILVICHSIIKIIDSSNSGNKILLEAAEFIVQHVDRDRIEEIANAMSSATTEIAERILSYLDHEN